MAVQAQHHPSNVLFLNRSGGQDGKAAAPPLGNDYSLLHPYSGGGGGGAGGGTFIDETEMLFNHGVDANSRKRGREHTSSTTAAAMSNPNPNPNPNPPLISLQSQPSQLIDLTQLHPNVVSTGLRLAFTDHRQHNHHSLSPQSSQSSVFFSVLAEDLGTHIKQQRDEIEHYLRAQGEQLRRTLEEKRQRHYRALLGAAEESLTRRLREKETEVDKAARRNVELEARAAQLVAEAQAWQARARAQELTAATLQAQLQQAMARPGCSTAHHPPERNDGGTAAGEAEDAESAYIDPDRVEVSAGSNCRACGKRAASVVLLPCRHLCLCRRCDAAAQACPLCLSFRSSSVEVFFC
ncbi:PREDICTED: BOI-related E3 ubiquitin-protein ligase 1-like [Ipomoea nil]|uniref:BOI-related E3 ubiquitin-protein ligase 1-like n=1 Tax=Ipomoea nil TaxID=35883 RepID=UPI000900F964|nr:PREDICTED: BOI-related E3 ubiquitin-protein ligase 1-like [Ipomoea nil]